MTDPYKVLHIRRNSSDTTVTKAYRKLAKSAHPDHDPGNENAAKKFQEIQDAYELLSDPDRRKLFDETGQTQPNKNAPPHVEFGQVVHQLLVGLMNQVVKNNTKMSQLDLMRTLNSAIDENIKAMRTQIVEFGKIKTNLTELLGRISTDSEENLFTGIITGQLKMLDNQLEQLEGQKGQFERVKNMLQTYRYRVDPQVMIGMISGAATTSNVFWFGAQS